MVVPKSPFIYTDIIYVAFAIKYQNLAIVAKEINKRSAEMPRIRTIKPEFFKDEDLVESCNHQTRMFYVGLWLYADREGRLEYRPKYLKAEIFPYESADVPKMVDKLANPNIEDKPEKVFLRLYQVGNKKYIQIIEFLKHQNCHKTEKDSNIPEYNELADLTVNAPLDNGESPDKNSRKGKEGKGRECPEKENMPKETFEDKWKRLPSEMKVGKQDAKISYMASVKTRTDEVFYDMCWENYYNKVKHDLNNGFSTRKWQNGKTWFNKYEDYKERVVPEKITAINQRLGV